MFATTESIWTLGWKPLLKAIVILCSDSRKQIRTTAIAYLQRALLVHDLQQLSPAEWCSCFSDVLFPLMTKLLEPINPLDPQGMEETRMRAATLLCKVFLQHLTPLMGLEGFTTLWMEILSFMEKYLKCDQKSELLTEAIPESLKNLLLVMDTAGVFHTPDGYTKLWALTWEKIDSFLPHLRAEMFTVVHPVSVQSQAQPQQPQYQQQQQPVPTAEQHYPAHVPSDQQTQGSMSLMNTLPPAEGDVPVFVSSYDSPSTISHVDPSSNVSFTPTIPIPISQPVETHHASSPGSTSPSPPVYRNSPEYTSISFGDDSPHDTEPFTAIPPVPLQSGQSADNTNNQAQS
jgi:hypothetical protein